LQHPQIGRDIQTRGAIFFLYDSEQFRTAPRSFHLDRWQDFAHRSNSRSRPWRTMPSRSEQRNSKAQSLKSQASLLAAQQPCAVIFVADLETIADPEASHLRRQFKSMPAQAARLVRQWLAYGP
jgi:hypothetical protein